MSATTRLDPNNLPTEIVTAAATLRRFFREHNITHWQLDAVCSTASLDEIKDRMVAYRTQLIGAQERVAAELQKAHDACNHAALNGSISAQVGTQMRQHTLERAYSLVLGLPETAEQFVDELRRLGLRN